MPSNEIELFKSQLVNIQRSFIRDFCFFVNVLAINLSSKLKKCSIISSSFSLTYIFSLP